MCIDKIGKEVLVISLNEKFGRFIFKYRKMCFQVQRRSGDADYSFITLLFGSYSLCDAIFKNPNVKRMLSKYKWLSGILRIRGNIKKELIYFALNI